MDEIKFDEPSSGKFQITVARLFGWILIVALVCSFFRYACFPLWEFGDDYGQISDFAGMMAIAVGLISIWESHAILGTLLLCVPCIAIGHFCRDDPFLYVPDIDGQRDVIAVCAMSGVFLSYLVCCIVVRQFNSERIPIWWMVALPIVLFCLSIFSAYARSR